ncbi:2-hydroxychromene-2-carboxylate isomerase [Marivita sp.]|uniref:2-hydroxychromene-2-carboxylate isomerase n=1 Tax=Marivita sp. TaxID=2003365 RepID=UPI003F6C9FA1
MPADPIIDYYFAPMSGYAYLGHAQLLEIASRAGVEIRYHPLDMAKVFAAAGSFPPAKYPAVRQHHRKADMKRWAEVLDLPLNDTPKFWPAPMSLACQVITAARDAGVDQGAVSHAILAAVWVHDLNIADTADITLALDKAGLDAKLLLGTATAPETVAKAEAHTTGAIDLGIFGSPTYCVKDDWFFGQDRLPLLQTLLEKSSENKV